MKIYGQLEGAALESLGTDPTAAVQGRVYYNTATSRFMLDNGTTKRAILRNDGNAVFGTDATAANNVRLHHAGAGLMQLVTGADTTAENALSSSLAQLGFRAANFAGLPAAGNTGRILFNTVGSCLQVDLGAAFAQLATVAGTETFTNKTLVAPVADVVSFTDQSSTPATPASGSTKLYTKSGQVYKLGSDGLETLVGSGSGSGAFNYLSNGDFEQGISTVQWAKATVASGIVTGLPTMTSTQGTSSLGLTVETTAPLRNTKSLRITAATAWAQGDGVALGPALTVQPEDAGKVLSFSLAYQVVSGSANLNFSGTIASQNLVLAVLDVTNGAWVPVPAGAYGINSSSVSGIVSCTFQTSVTAGQRYQPFLFNAGATTSGACAVLVDDVIVGPQKIVNGTPVSDWVNAGPLIVSATTTAPTKGTTTVDRVYWRRVGQVAQVRIEYVQTTAGTAGSGDYLFSLPANLKADLTQITAYNTVVGSAAPFTPSNDLGGGSIRVSSTNHFIGARVHLYDQSTFRMSGISINMAGTTSLNGGMMGPGAGGFNQAAYTMSVAFEFPVAGFSSNVQMSSDTDTRVIAAKIGMTGSSSVTSGTKIAFNSVVFDNAGSFSTGNNNYVVPVSGFYELTVAGSCSTGGTTPYVYKNAVQDSPLATINTTGASSGSAVVLCNAGDTLDIRADATATVNSTTRLTIKRLSGPSVVASSESVNCTYGLTTAQAVGAGAVVKFDTKLKDSHSFFSTSTGLATIPVTGQYRISAMIQASVQTAFYVVVNGAAQGFLGTCLANNPSGGSMSLNLQAGATVGIYIYAAGTCAGPNAVTANGAYTCHLTIERTGN